MKQISVQNALIITTLSMSNNNDDSDNVPETLNRNSNEIMFPRLSSRTNINQCFAQPNNEDNVNVGGITDLKAAGNIRLLSINPKGCALSNQNKMSMLKESIKKHQINILLMNETNAK